MSSQEEEQKEKANDEVEKDFPEEDQLSNAKDFLSQQDRCNGQFLRLTASMFRQHSDLFLRQASILERVASNPADPPSWGLEEPTPEKIQEQIYRENTMTLAIKAYESMRLVQMRVNYLERLMIRNGVSKKVIPRTRKRRMPEERPAKQQDQKPRLWFDMEHKGRQTLASKDGSTKETKEKLLRLWQSTPPNERLPYVTKARESRERYKRQPKRPKTKKASRAMAKKKKQNDNKKTSEDEDEDDFVVDDDTSDSGDDSHSAAESVASIPIPAHGTKKDNDSNDEEVKVLASVGGATKSGEEQGNNDDDDDDDNSSDEEIKFLYSKKKTKRAKKDDSSASF